jgi:hypothetical protein
MGFLSWLGGNVDVDRGESAGAVDDPLVGEDLAVDTAGLAFRGSAAVTAQIARADMTRVRCRMTGVYKPEPAVGFVA